MRLKPVLILLSLVKLWHLKRLLFDSLYFMKLATWNVTSIKSPTRPCRECCETNTPSFLCLQRQRSTKSSRSKTKRDRHRIELSVSALHASRSFEHRLTDIKKPSGGKRAGAVAPAVATVGGLHLINSYGLMDSLGKTVDLK